MPSSLGAAAQRAAQGGAPLIKRPRACAQPLGGSWPNCRDGSGWRPPRATPSSSSSATDSSAPLNRHPVIATTMDAETYTYLLAHTREPAPLAKLRATTEGLRGAHMQVAPEQGALLALLAELTNARRCLEVGVFTGYSSLAVALALKRGEERDKERENDSDSTTDQRDQNRRDEGAQNTDDQKKDRNRVLVALDRDEGMMAVARSAWREAGVEHLVDGRVGAALPELDAMLEDPDEVESYDLAFIDADKRAYPQYYERCLRLIRPGGLAVVDNVLFYGRVATPERCAGDKAATALREFNSLLLKDERISLSILPVGDGMALCWKRP